MFSGPCQLVNAIAVSGGSSHLLIGAVKQKVINNHSIVCKIEKFQQAKPNNLLYLLLTFICIPIHLTRTDDADNIGVAVHWFFTQSHWSCCENPAGRRVTCLVSGRF